MVLLWWLLLLRDGDVNDAERGLLKALVAIFVVSENEFNQGTDSLELIE
jgi:hypothetical protein